MTNQHFEWYSTRNPPRGLFIWIIEQHWRGCRCSYCHNTFGTKKLHWALNRPLDPTGWIVFVVPLLVARLYVRWTRVRR